MNTQRRLIATIGVDCGELWLAEPEPGFPDLDTAEDRYGEPYGQGRGVLVRTGYGDGTYPVFATMVEDPLAPGSFRVGAVTIEFVGDATEALNAVEDVLDSEGVADRLGVARETVARYRSSGALPAPDLMLGRSPGWYAATIDDWRARRPGRGAGGGRPPS